MIVAGIFTTRGPLASTERNVYSLAQVVVWTVTLVSFLNITDPGLSPFGGFWVGELSIEIALFALTLEHHVPKVPLEFAQFGLGVFRIVIILFLLSTVVQRLARGSHEKGSDEEAAPLLINAQEAVDGAPRDASGYGSLNVNGQAQTSDGNATDANEGTEEEDEDEDAKKEREDMEKMKNHIREKGGWFAYVKDFKVGL